MKCRRCHTIEAQISWDKGDLADARKKLVMYQEQNSNKVEATAADILRAQSHLRESEEKLVAHQADEHPDPPPSSGNGPGFRLHADDITELKAMLADGIAREEIADAFGVTVSTVTYHAIRAGYSRAGETTNGDAPPEVPHPFAYPAWFDRALCAQIDPEAFFPEKGGSTREAKAMCARCPVAAECLDHALANNERFGIWGGLSERERRKISRHLDNTQPETA